MSPANREMLKLSYSPCPNDTFMFNALVNGFIDTGDIHFDTSLHDVEVLNRMAIRGGPDITKLSFFAFAFAADDYALLDSGSALGKGCGPLVVARKHYSWEKISGLTVAVPGRYTTASFLFSLAFPEAQNRKEMLFSDIENAVLKREADVGVIIHESRFTYEQKGLIKILDLGEYWEKLGNPIIPLGGIAVKRSLPDDVKRKVNRVMRKSVEFALADPGSARDYVRQHAQEMDEEVMYRHIDLYVNRYSVDLGTEGRNAVSEFFSRAAEKKIAPAIGKPLFLDQ